MTMSDLQNVLLNNCPDKGHSAKQFITGHLKTLEPFFRRTEKEGNSLWPGSEYALTAAADAISCLTGKNVNRVICVSSTQDLHVPPYLTPLAFERMAVQDKIVDSMQELFCATVLSELAEDLRESFSYDTLQKIKNGMRAHLWNGLWESYRTDIGAELGLRFGNIVKSTVQQSLFCYLGYMVSLDEGVVLRMKYLMDTLPHVIPLGEKKNEPGTLLALTR